MKRMLVIPALILAVAATVPFTLRSTSFAQAPGRAALPPSPASPTEPATVTGKVDAVTVYRGQALVTRVVDVAGPSILKEIIVTDLPDHVVPASLFAEASDGVEVRSIRYRVRPVPQDVREEVRKLDDDIKALQDQLAANHKQQTVLAEQRAYLDKLANFVAPTATTEMTKGVLNADQLKTLTQFQFTQRADIANQELKLANDARDLQDKLNLKNRQRNEITSGSAKSVREAIVFVNQTKPGQLRVRYLVDQANWTPSYNVRAEGDAKEAKVEYQASIEQMSGEDWTNVSMTLSTATPSLIAAAPQLNPLQVSLAAHPAGGPEASQGKIAYRDVAREIYTQRQAAEFARNAKPNASGQGLVISGGNINISVDNDVRLNTLADQLQVLELVAKETKKDEGLHKPTMQEQIVVTYPLASRTTLPSRADRQLIQIATTTLKATPTKVAIPVLTNYVYNEAQVTNTSDKVFLAGPVASYMNNQFVGSGELPTIAIGQNFTVGFGIDSALRATRERLDKEESIQGGNKVVTYTYRIAVENFGATEANVRILDRLPTAKDSEVKVTFTDAPSAPLSTDKEYQQFERKKGILRWDVKVPPQKNGSEAFAITYKMQMEYDKNLQIAGQTLQTIQAIDKQLEQYRR